MLQFCLNSRLTECQNCESAIKIKYVHLYKIMRMCLASFLNILIFLMDFNFQSSFGFIAKLSRSYRDFSYTLYPLGIATPIIDQSGAFVTAGESLLTHHNNSNPVVYIRFTLGVHYVDVYKCIICTHHCSIIQNTFTALKTSLCSLCSSLPLP